MCQRNRSITVTQNSISAVLLAECLISASLCSVAPFHTFVLTKRLPSNEEKVGFQCVPVGRGGFQKDGGILSPEGCSVAICRVSRPLHCLHCEAGGTLAASKVEPGTEKQDITKVSPNSTRSNAR